jgi:F-type H+-transporting ATPase subunit delta
VSRQARPQDYAQAIFDLALEAWIRQLTAVSQVLQKDVGLREAVYNTGHSVSTRLEALAAALPGHLDGEVRNFLGTLIEAGQLEQLDAILAELSRLASRQPERRLARVTSAVPLTPGEQATLRAKLVAQYGADLEFEFNVDPSLIGGIHLRVGDKVIDGSVAGKLAALRDRLAA